MTYLEILMNAPMPVSIGIVADGQFAAVVCDQKENWLCTGFGKTDEDACEDAMEALTGGTVKWPCQKAK